MIANVTQFADSSAGGIGALGIDGKALIIQLITFLLAFLVLKKWAFGPIIKAMDQRRETIESGVKLGEELRLAKEKLEHDIEKQLHVARTKADGIITEAESAARDTVRGAEEKAAEKAAVIINEGKARGEQEVTRARKALEAELVGLVSDATETIIGEKVDAKKDASLIDGALKGAKA